MSRSIYITEFDKKRLLKLIDEEKEFHQGNKDYLKTLEHELNRAHVVDPKEVPGDVITMNSKVLLKDLDTGEEMIYTLVFPADADLLEDKISVLAPVGTAILGYWVGAILDWKVPNGVVRLKVEKIIYQPEAAGDYEM
ncbi:nucleoside diphosphate kinase regulator [Desulforamulus ruminis]|uniref:Transcription elongation factor GreA/GreB domain-containing protein n=1 Tax=Desulforamulus ruminis (strain ATCC 23193 / DSM 2154 / NCIMB 8452 / DL) TaxID=696281 RepID=F6DPS6_DESRL|nr:nucleoside diphosphate kinase regulator [Desulforamulus ruminis]AEG60765.1 transcription elongation factor GreA/GreB domain-containing protein [Desulforamulus ruminis DSM 2154]